MHAVLANWAHEAVEQMPAVDRSAIEMYKPASRAVAMQIGFVLWHRGQAATWPSDELTERSERCRAHFLWRVGGSLRGAAPASPQHQGQERRETNTEIEPRGSCNTNLLAAAAGVAKGALVALHNPHGTRGHHTGLKKLAPF